MHRAILLLRKIPQGKVVTYKELARVCQTSPRAIGRVMAGNQDPVNNPCYKVISTTGAVGGYSGEGGLLGKQRLLEKEGIFLVKGKVEKKHFFQYDR